MNDWKKGGEAYLPMLAAAEQRYGIPPDLLARMAFQESSWRPGVINGTIKSPAGAIGIMQMEPLFFPHIDLTQPNAAIDAAGHYLKQLFLRFGDWKLATAAYNAGPGTVHRYGGVPPYPETENYVAQIFADVTLPAPPGESPAVALA